MHNEKGTVVPTIPLLMAVIIRVAAAPHTKAATISCPLPIIIMGGTKNKPRRHRSIFACTESWQVEHLVKVVRKAYPVYSEQEVRAAVTACCLTVGAPHPRQAFVECVMRRVRSQLKPQTNPSNLKNIPVPYKVAPFTAQIFRNDNTTTRQLNYNPSSINRARGAGITFAWTQFHIYPY
jgi:hypothetical protein